MLNLKPKKMKKSTFCFLMMLLSLTALPTSALAAPTDPIAISATTKEIPVEVKVLLNRLDEIKKMDKSNLNRSEKKALRKEVRAINSNLRSTGNGVYLSVGAIIIIVLLLIILL
jgi:Skp family chaperone for outer membrane proteins